MAKLTYWFCESLSDSSVYNIRTKSKKEAVEERIKRGEEYYTKPVKHEINYKNAFDLLDICLSEARGYE